MISFSLLVMISLSLKLLFPHPTHPRSFCFTSLSVTQQPVNTEKVRERLCEVGRGLGLDLTPESITVFWKTEGKAFVSLVPPRQNRQKGEKKEQESKEGMYKGGLLSFLSVVGFGSFLSLFL